MRFNTLCVVTLVSVVVGVSVAAAAAVEDVKALYEVDQVFGPELAARGDREKKEIGLKVAAGFGVKNFILDLLFGKVNQVIDYKTKLVSNFDRTNRYKNYYLLGLGTRPKGSAPTGGSGQGGGGGGVGGGSGTTTEAAPVLDGQKVNLDLPPMLFASGFTLVTNVSKVVGGVISNTARRTQRLVEAFKPFLGKFLHVETGDDRSKRETIPASIARLAEHVEFMQMTTLE